MTNFFMVVKDQQKARHAHFQATVYTVLALLILLANQAIAGPNANAKILLHIASPTTKSQCVREEALPQCSEITTSAALYPTNYFAYMLAVDVDSSSGIAAAQFGIEYNETAQQGIDIFEWKQCSNAAFPDGAWPNSGSGIVLTWDPIEYCQRTVVDDSTTTATLGYFYCTAYSADTFYIRSRPADGLALVVGCVTLFADTLESPTFSPTPSQLGYAKFSIGASTPGYNPCGY